MVTEENESVKRPRVRKRIVMVRAPLSLEADTEMIQA